MNKQGIGYGDAGLADALVVELCNFLRRKCPVPDGNVVELAFG